MFPNQLHSNHIKQRYASPRDFKPHERSKQMDHGWILSSDQMQFLRNNPYYYCASCGSYLEMFFLQRFWTKLAKFIPHFVAPSLLTFTGLTINILCSLNVLYYSFDLKSDVPSWAFLICATGLFLYQTLDALDGKQSAKVQNTQIEELTDHGCDAVSTIFVALTAASAVQLGNYPSLLYLYAILMLTAFFSTHWLAHITHCMVFKKIDVSEAQWSMILIHLITAQWGQKIWSIPLVNVFGFQLDGTQLMAILTILSLSHCIFDNLQMSVLGKKTPLEENEILIPRRRSQAIYNPIHSLGLLILLSMLNYLSGLVSLSVSVFVILYGFAFARLVINLVMQNVSRGETEKWDLCLAAPLLLTLNQLVGLIHPYTALLCASIYSIMDFLRFFTYACWDLKAALDVHILSVRYPLGHPKSRGGNEGFYINGFNNEAIREEWKKFEAQERNGLVKVLFGYY